MIAQTEARRQRARTHNERKQWRFDGKMLTTRTRVDAETKQSNTSNPADFFAVASLELFLHTPYSCFTKFLHRCVRTKKTIFLM